MSSYDILVDAYDELFPLNGAMVHFIEQQMGGRMGGIHLLDAGCGTGALAIALARHNAGVKAFDLNALMVRKAEANRPQALNLEFKTGSLSEIQQLYSGQLFDGILCVGNTLVHLPDRDAILLFLDQTVQLLKPGGKLIVQIVNYDNIMSHKPASLPLITTQNHTFRRLYEYTGAGHVRFVTHLANNFNDGVVIQSTLLFLCERAFLEEELKRRFQKVEFFGSFDALPWSIETFHTIAVAQK